MTKKSSFNECLEAAIRLLKARDRFQSELQAGLEAKGFGPEDIKAVLAHLLRRKLIDDRNLIENLAARMSGRRAVGAERLRAELIKRGAPEELIDEYLANSPPENPQAAMVALLSSKFKPTDDRARGARFLLGRGFDPNEIESPLDQFFQSTPDE